MDELGEATVVLCATRPRGVQAGTRQGRCLAESAVAWTKEQHCAY